MPSDPKTAPVGFAPTANLRLDPADGTLHRRRHRVVVLDGAHPGAEVTFDERLEIGTLPDCGLQLQDESVSRRHLLLEVTPRGVALRDLGSTNGTKVSGVRVQEALVEGAAVLTLGRTRVRLEPFDEKVEVGEYSGSQFGSAKGGSAPMRRLFALLSSVAPSDATILLTGETGTGKEELARSIHLASARKDRPFVVLDCGAIAPNLAESQLFGHTRGAFSGATNDRKGAFAEADGGTLFLDEIGELPPSLQPKLLRALEAGEVTPVGKDSSRLVDVRVVAATHRELATEVKAGRFRQDLFFRLAVLVVRVPPLRERLEDLPLLVRHFVAQLGRPEFDLSPEVLAELKQHPWPGNVRELRNVVERVLAGGGLELRAGEPPSSPVPAELAGLPYKDAKEKLVDSFTRDYLASLLERCDYNVSEVARVSGVARNYVHKLINRYGLKSR
jgi:DNA-binding NtrC family response regulator